AAAGVASATGATSAALPRERTWAGEFRVEAFRVPLIEARLVPPPAVPPGARELTLGVQMSYLAGGGVQAPGTSLSALLAPRGVAFEGYDGWRFDAPRTVREGVAAGPDDEEAAPAAEAGRLVVDKQPVATDRQGAAQVLLRDLPAIDRPSELLAELRFTDPSGETQTVARRVALWPSAVVVGLRAPPWARQGTRTAVDVVALDTAGVPQRGQAVQVRGRLVQVSSTRKRLVGGFYAYENRTDVRDLGVVCEGRSDERGQLRCEAVLAAPGEVELIAEARDASGRVARAATSVWVTRAGDLWFGQDDDDRIDLVPEKRRVAPGETARLQVRSPFREATALVSIEREGVIDTRVVTLRGDDPTVEVKVDPAWTPNVVVSVLAVRGRIRSVPWTSFFDWGWREPVAWWRAWRDEGPQHQPPTPLVDLAKPSFKLGATMLAVGGARHDLQVSVVPDAPRYAIRQTAQVRVRVTRDGQPLSAPAQAGAAPVVDVAFAAVDEGLLALADNPSWDLKAGLLRERPWGVSTSTAHGEIVGRRHYGRKAVAAGGGGGRGATRELFDTLLVWKASVALDANGEAVVPVPLNDSLTRFRLVAVADALIAEGPGEPLPAFGTGSATIEVSQDLQVLPGLPLLMREGDRLDALLTVRNTTPRPMSLDVRLRGLAVARPGGTAPPVIAPPPQSVQVAAGAAAELRFAIEVPPEVAAIEWEAVAEEAGAGPARATDRVRRRVPVAAAVPLRVQQATIAPVAADSALAVPVAPPPGALTSGGVARGGVQVALRPRLADGLPGLVRWFEAYPYSCLEQRASRALALDDRAGWEALVATLPAHLDADGLAAFFPLAAGEGIGPGRGSDRLTAHLVAAAHEAGAVWPAEVLEPMLGGLLAFVEGRLERRGFAPPASRGLDRDVRRLAALEALSRHGRAEARHLGTLRVDLAAWPTAALIDWLAVLRRVPRVPEAARRADEARAALRQRLDFSGTTLRFSREAEDLWWWSLDSPDGNAARLVLAAVDDPAWADDLPRLVTGHLGRQRDGAWLTTTANLWSALALRRFSQRFESTPVAGRTVAALAGVEQVHDWTPEPAGGVLTFAWTGAGPATLALRHEGPGRPWVTLQAEAAVPLTAPRRAGYGIERRVVAVDRRTPDAWSRGDVLRVRLEIEAAADMSWVVVDDPVPAGATVLGSGLARDSVIAQRDEGREAQRDGTALAVAPTYVERTAGAWRAYFEWLPRGRHVLEYTVRLNQPGRFGLPPTRVEAMYAPDRFGEAPNAALEVRP
ncbi:MAG: alpha-2-macroglobulin, partial [Ideonella sp.]|nr:alpha-2-macroglobulin [Ideonella sp.]